MILVFGKTGQVGSVLAKMPNVVALGRDEANLEYPQECFDRIIEYSPDAVINAAAFTAVDEAERQPKLASQINGIAPGYMARACAMLQIPFIHLSTDYVFAGEGRVPHEPNDKTAPLNVYGESKLQAERLIVSSGCVYGILRTSWVFSHKGKNFLTTMLSLSERHTMISIVDDQYGGPTPALALGNASLNMAYALINHPQKAGIFHLSGKPNVSWYDFAVEIFHFYNKKIELKRVSTEDYNSEAIRPKNSRLNCNTLTSAFNIERPHWQDFLQKKDLNDKES